MDDLDGFYSIDQLLMELESDHFPDEEADADDDFTSEGFTADLESPLNGSSFTATEANNIVSILKPELPLHKRRLIVDSLLQNLTNEVLPWGTQTKLAREIGVHKSTISRIFKYANDQRKNGEVIDVRSKKGGTVGRKPYDYNEEWLQSVPLHLRTTERSFAGYLKVSPCTVHRLKKRGKLRSHTSSNHPALTETHKLKRMQWVLSHIHPATRISPPIFSKMTTTIHTDEKWFYLNPETRRFLLLPREDDPHRVSISKRYKLKVMFMAVISRPLYDGEGNLEFDGKFGIFPFSFQRQAKKSSKNRAAGTWETFANQNINAVVIRQMLLEHVIPAIKEKWPANMPKDLTIQWDNARPHKIPTDEELLEATTTNGWNIQMVFQPPQSPDFNVLDLGLFRSIQSLQYQSFPKDLDELISKVKEAWDEFEPDVNKYTWLTLQTVMKEVLKVKGGNNYKIPHMGKRSLDRQGILPTDIEVEQSLIDEAVAYLNERIIIAPQMHNDEAEMQMEVDAD